MLLAQEWKILHGFDLVIHEIMVRLQPDPVLTVIDVIGYNHLKFTEPVIVNAIDIDDAKLDELILNARQSADQAYRKEVYKAALNEIMDWAVEIPAYQRQNIVIASTERVDISTVTPDVTTYWGWLAEVQTMNMNAAK